MKWNSLKFNDLVETEKKRRRITNNGDIAVLMGVSINTLQNAMKGLTVPSVEYLCKMALFLKVDFPAFFDYDESEHIVSSPITLYEPETELSKCYKIMYEQQREIADQQKEMTELVREIEKLKKPNAPGKIADVGS